MKLLESVLRLGKHDLERLAARWHIPIDPKKRLTLGEQVARGLVLLPRWLEAVELSAAAREAVRLLAAAPRGLTRDSLPAGFEPLLEQGLLHPDPASPARVGMPAAFRVQLPASPSDSPRAARLLLQGLSEETRRELCQHHLRRIPPLPWPMLLEPVLERLEDADWIKAELASLTDGERGLLWAVDALGGEVSGEEVLELEREPVRIAHGGSVQVPRRSAIFSLARRGLVIARPEGWLMPDEVERVVGRERRTKAAIERQRLLMSRHLHELTPARASLAESPGLAAVALMAALASFEELPAEGRGLSKGATRRAAQHLHVEPERAELLLCLGRADGLFSAHTSLRSASERLWDAWRRGGAWDEAALEPDAFRPGQSNTARATGLLREAVLETLSLLPAGEFALVSDVQAVACGDRRALAAQRGLTRAARTNPGVVESVSDLIALVLRKSLPLLGLVDVGRVEMGEVIRLSREARAWLDEAPTLDKHLERPEAAAEWRDALRLGCASTCEVVAVIEAARYAEVWLEPNGVGLGFSEASLARAADHDPDFAGLMAALGALTRAPSESLQELLRQASEKRPMCTLIRTAAFVEIEDPALSQAIYRDPQGRELWAAPPLAQGLLVKPGASLAKVHEILTRYGARLYSD